MNQEMLTHYFNRIGLPKETAVTIENLKAIHRAQHRTIPFENFDIVKEKFLGDLEFVNDAYTTFVNWKPIRDEVIDFVKNGEKSAAARITKEKGNDHMILLFQKTGPK